MRLNGLGMSLYGLGMSLNGLGMRLHGLGMRLCGMGMRLHGLGMRLTASAIILPQGKSRSATAVTAYIMASREMGFEESLQLVQAQRKMAEPNPTFIARLKQFEKSDALKQLRSKLD